MKTTVTRTIVTMLMLAACCRTADSAPIDGAPEDSYTMVGAPGLSRESLDDAKNFLLRVPKLKAKRNAVLHLLKGAEYLKSTSQVVAGENHVYLLKTNRGFECFRIYEPLFEEKCELSRYSRGKNEAKVWNECQSFWGAIPSSKNVKRFLAK